MKVITAPLFLLAILATLGHCQYYDDGGDYAYVVYDAPVAPRGGLRAGFPYVANNPLTRPADTSTGFLNKYTSGQKWNTPYPGTYVSESKITNQYKMIQNSIK